MIHTPAATLRDPFTLIASPALSPRSAALVVAAACPVYGLAMGCYGAGDLSRAAMPLYAAIKCPLLVLVTTVIVLPAYFTLNTVLGLREDFRAAFGAITAGQAAFALALASLAPITLFAYRCGLSHPQAVMFNALCFAVAAAAAQVVMVRRFRPLLAANPRHGVMLAAWLLMYAFVGTQLGWMLRPFIGTPGKPVEFLRDEPFSNAYVVVVRLAWRSLGGS